MYSRIFPCGEIREKNRESGKSGKTGKKQGIFIKKIGNDQKNQGKVRYDDFEKFIHGEGGVAADGTLVQNKAKPKRKKKTLGEILIAMQKQQQRTILLNPPLFSGIYVHENSEEGVKQLLLQFRLIGFDITAIEAKKILDAFGISKS